jgi:hypothetical protein
MLFDLRSRGRRRIVKVVYLGLALLIGGGLVLFGIGGSVSGGLVDAFNGNGGSSDSSIADRVDKAQERVDKAPRDADAWAALAVARYQSAGSGDNVEQVVDESTGAVGRRFTEAGQAELHAADRAWQRYLSLDPPKTDPGTAAQMVQLYAQGALDDPAKAARAQELAIDEKLSGAGQYAQLAVFAYRAGQTRKGDLAAGRALELAVDKAQRKEFQQVFDEAKTGQAAAATTTTPAG